MNLFNGIVYVFERLWFYLEGAFNFFFGWIF